MTDKKTSDPVQAFSDAFASYQTALIEVAAPPALQQRWLELQREFLSVGNDPQRQIEVFRHFTQFASEFRNLQRISAGAESAYRELVRAVQDGFGRIEPDSLAPAQLLVIARGIVCAASFAASTTA